MTDLFEETKSSLATVGILPFKSGDGYSYGGGTILMIGHVAIDIGEGQSARLIAQEIADRWNAAFNESKGTTYRRAWLWR